MGGGGEQLRHMYEKMVKQMDGWSGDGDLYILILLKGPFESTHMSRILFVNHYLVDKYYS